MRTLTTLFLSAVCLSANAQKLPNVQQVSLRAPVNVKTDGKATEWSNKFEAENAATELFYTIANDDKKLYIVVQTGVETVFNRIANGGIKLVVQKSGVKNDDGAAFVKFPFKQGGERLLFSFAGQPIAIPQGNGVRILRNDAPLSKEKTEQLTDSLTLAHNNKIKSTLKLVYTSGIAGIVDPLPIYNDKGIEAAAAFDNTKMLTCEIAIDLNLLGLSAAKGEKFSYHIVVNGEPFKYSPRIPTITGSTNPDGTPASADALRAINERAQNTFAARGATTDFWGEYILAK